MGTSRATVGIALSGGGAAGMAHVGVLEALEDAGIPVRVVAGTSFGAVVGAAFAANALPAFRDTMCALTRTRVLRLFDPTWPHTGLLEGRRCLELVRHCLADRIETLPTPFAAIATDLDSGAQVTLREGSVFDAVRASMAFPGLLTPQVLQGRVLVDGGLVNPIPVDVARSLGATFVIAVSVVRMPGSPPVSSSEHHGLARWLLARGSHHRGRTTPQRQHPPGDSVRPGLAGESSDHMGHSTLGIIDVLSRGSSLVQGQIAAARLRDTPPDCMVAVPPLHMGLFDFHRSREAVEAGRRATQLAMPGIERALADASRIPRRLRPWQRLGRP